jgi:anti-sigma regulatory factor (Ser/Thr protein kinase)
MTVPTAGSVRCLMMRSEPVALRELTDWVTALLAAAGAPDLQQSVELAVHEVCMNVIDHAYGPGHLPRPDDITVDGEFDAEAVTVRVRDSGVTCERPVGHTPTPDQPTVRGYGLVIVEKLVEELIYQRLSHTNVWRLRFALPARAQANSVEVQAMGATMEQTP